MIESHDYLTGLGFRGRISMEFQEKLMFLRKERGWSQEELGEKVSVTRQTVSKWELGQTTPELAKLIELGELFQISIDELVGREKESTQKFSSQGIPDCYGERDFGHFYRTTYEYKSKKRFLGMPLVHIHFGRGNCTAKGIIAVGNCAVGFLSLGIASVGLISVGVASLGLLAYGVACLGLLASAGGVAIGGFFALGGVAVSCYFAVGGVAAGASIAIGGCAAANQLAIGGAAAGTVAVGKYVDGTTTFAADSNFSNVDWNAVRIAVEEQCRRIPEWLLKWILRWMSR